MQYVHKRVIDLTDEELEACRKLSYGDEGYMCEDIDRALHTETRRRYRYTRAILAIDEHGRPGRILGWSLVQPVWHSPRYTAQFFVNPDYRRRGIGARLLKEANKYGTRAPYVYMDDDNEEFFKVFPQLCKEF